MSKEKKIILILPFIVSLLFLALGVNDRVILTLFMMVWMVTWWIFEIAPLGVTALLPMIFMPFSGLIPLKKITPYYANHIIYLFLGGFIIARGLEKTRLNERIALVLLNLTGKSDWGIVLGF